MTTEISVNIIRDEVDVLIVQLQQFDVSLQAWTAKSIYEFGTAVHSMRAKELLDYEYQALRRVLAEIEQHIKTIDRAGRLTILNIEYITLLQHKQREARHRCIEAQTYHIKRFAQLNQRTQLSHLTKNLNDSRGRKHLSEV